LLAHLPDKIQRSEPAAQKDAERVREIPPAVRRRAARIATAPGGGSGRYASAAGAVQRRLLARRFRRALRAAPPRGAVARAGDRGKTRRRSRQWHSQLRRGV